MVHGVSRLCDGVRYSLFVVDRDNGLGGSDVHNVDAAEMERILPLMRRAPATPSGFIPTIPFSDIALGAVVGHGASKTVYEGT